MAKIASPTRPSTAITAIEKNTGLSLAQKLGARNLSLAGPQIAGQAPGADLPQEGGLPWLAFSPGKGQHAIAMTKANGMKPTGDGLGFIISGGEAHLLRGGPVKTVAGIEHIGGPLIFAFDAVSCYGVASNDGPLAEAKWEKYTSGVPGKKSGLQGRFYGLVAWYDGAEWRASLCTCRTGPGRRDGFSNLLNAAALAKDEGWLAAHAAHANIHDDLAAIRCGIVAEFPPINHNGTKWTGFRGAITPLPLSQELSTLLLTVIEEALGEEDQLGKAVEWLAREQAEIEKLAGPRPEGVVAGVTDAEQD